MVTREELDWKRAGMVRGPPDVAVDLSSVMMQGTREKLRRAGYTDEEVTAMHDVRKQYNRKKGFPHKDTGVPVFAPEW